MNKISFLILALFLLFVNCTVFQNASAKNFQYSVYGSKEFPKKDAKFDDNSTVLFIMDFSNSMNDKLEDKTKLKMALENLTVILPKIPDNIRTGLRIYGHKAGFTYLQGCMASKLAVPFASRNADSILTTLYNTKAVGWTPITYSLKQAVNSDFAGVKGRKHIVLLTDGGENCDESPCDYAIELMKSRDDISIDVIAFNVDDVEANNQLRCAAVATRGRFYTADTQKELLNSLYDSFSVDKNVRGTIKMNEN